jgi:hypothetical protein
VAYLDIIVPAGAAVGQTVDAKIGKTTVRVMLLGQMTLRIEPKDGVYRIVSGITEDGQTTMCVLKAAKVAPAAFSVP